MFSSDVDGATATTKRSAKLTMATVTMTAIAAMATTTIRPTAAFHTRPATSGQTKEFLDLVKSTGESYGPPYSGEDVSKQDSVMVSTAISNGEDLGPFVRPAFVSGKPETLLQSLRQFCRSREAEIEEVCKSHYQDFSRAMDDLRSLPLDVDSLKSSLHESNSVLQSLAGPLLSSLDAYIEAHNQSRNLAVALSFAGDDNLIFTTAVVAASFTYCSTVSGWPKIEENEIE